MCSHKESEYTEFKICDEKDQYTGEHMGSGHISHMLRRETICYVDKTRVGLSDFPMRSVLMMRRAIRSAGLAQGRPAGSESSKLASLSLPWHISRRSMMSSWTRPHTWFPCSPGSLPKCTSLLLIELARLQPCGRCGLALPEASVLFAGTNIEKSGFLEEWKPHPFIIFQFSDCTEERRLEI